MFDFQKLKVYTYAKEFAGETLQLIKDSSFDAVINDQLKRASLSIMLNIAEGSSRFSNRDRRHFMIIARGSTFECAALLEFLRQHKLISSECYQSRNDRLEEISRMLYGLIKKLS